MVRRGGPSAGSPHFAPGSGLGALCSPLRRTCRGSPIARWIRSRQATARLFSSHSQILITWYPSARAARRRRRSRHRFRPIFAAQYAVFVLGMWPQRGQPCQKQPSTNTATFARGKIKSGEPTSFCERVVHSLTPARTSIARRRHSVVRLPREMIARMFQLRSGGGGANGGSFRAVAGIKGRSFQLVVGSRPDRSIPAARKSTLWLFL